MFDNVMKTKKEEYSSLAVMLAGMFWGTIIIFVKNLNAAGSDSFQISATRCLAASIALIIFCLIKDKALLKIKIKDLWMFLYMGLISLEGYNLCYFYAATHGETSVASVLQYTSPVWVMLLSAIFFKERITKIKLIALILTFTGCAFVSGIIGQEINVSLFVAFMGVMAGFVYATYSIVGKFAIERGYSPFTIITYNVTIAALGTLPLGKPMETIAELSLHPEAIPYAIGFGIIALAVPYCLYTWGLGGIETGKAAILVAIEPVVSMIIGVLVYHESSGFFKLFGLAMVLAAIILMNLNLEKK